MYKTTLFHRIAAFIMIACILQSCTYYRFRTLPNDADTATKQKHIDKKEAYNYYYIVHQGDLAVQLENVAISETGITGTIESMHPTVKRYMESAYNGGGKRVPREDLKYINQIHVFVDSLPDSQSVSIKTEDIERIDLMSMNRGLKIVTITATTAVSAVAAFTIFLLIACSCPHTYVFDGEKYYFNNTLFTGATSQKLERHDYKIMPDYAPDSDNYSFIVRNEEDEQQFTNLLELLVVQHDDNTEISMDQAGNIYALKNVIAPTQVKDNSGIDLMDIVGSADDLGHMFDNESEEDYNSVVATFDKPTNSENAKVVLNVKNHQWGGLVFNEFSKMFGHYHDNWAKKIQKKPKDEIEAGIKRAGIPLTVAIKSNGQWVELEDVNLVGDVNYNSITIPINKELLTEDAIEIRVQSGFMFWELDRINMDFSEPSEVFVQRLSPSSAAGSNNTNDTQNLAHDDHLYMEHLISGDSTSVTFTGIENVKGMQRTIFLHSKGYYLSQKEFQGKPQREELVKIDVEGGLSIYSRNLYNELLGNLTLNSAD